MTDTHLLTELAEGAGVLLAAALAFVALRRAARPNRRLARLWQPLAPIVNGRTQGATLVGTYDRLPVLARIADEGEDANSFVYELTVTTPPGGENWQALVTGQKFLGGGEQMWRVKSSNDALAQRLAQHGVAEHVSTLPPDAQVTYTAKSGALALRTRVNGPLSVPAETDFRAHLDLLAQLVRINAAENAAAR